MNELELYLKNLQNDCKLTLYKSSGPGGQHKNKTESAVRLQHLPTGICVTASESRSQRMNRKMAWTRLIKKLQARYAEEKPRKRTVVPKAARERRLRNKKRKSLLKSTRKKPDQSDSDQAFFISAI